MELKMNNNDQTVPTRVAFYLRVSTDEQVERYGLDLQKSAIEGILRAKGTLSDGQPAMVLAGPQYIYKDEGVSGTDPVDIRPAFVQMKEDIENSPNGVKPFDAVVVYRIDRFARRLTILLNIVEYFNKKEVQFISASENIDTSTPFGRAILGIIGVIAELEIETTKARTQAGKKQAIEEGVFMGPSPPFGYKKNERKKLIIFRKEAKVVEEIFNLFTVQKKKVQQIADYLTSENTLTPLASSIVNKKRKGSKKAINNGPTFWRDTVVREILENEIYTGNYYYNKYKKGGKGERNPREEWILSATRHPLIIDNGQFAMAQKRIKEEISLRNSSKTASNHIYLLSGLLKCHACNDSRLGKEPLNWVGTTKMKDGKRSYYYQCGGKNTKKNANPCKTIPFPAGAIEDFMVNFIKELLKDPKYIYQHINSLKSTKAKRELLRKHQTRLIEKINKIPIRRKNLIDEHGLGLLETKDLKKHIQNLEKEGGKLNSDLKNIENLIGEDKISDIYVEALKEFSKKYKKFFDGKLKKRKELFNLIHLIVDKINIYAREATESDKIAGRKKEGQLIPNSIRIDLRLPQDMLVSLAEDRKFEVKNATLRRGWELNPSIRFCRPLSNRLTTASD